MHWRNSPHGYGLMAILFHWVVVVGVIGLFALGLWMVDLSYYDPNYRSSLALHKSIGVTLFVVVAARLVWRWLNPQPRPHGRVWEQRLASLVHGLLYLVLFAAMIAGYLISTADGRPIDVFGWFELPATLTGENQEDRAGAVHEILVWTLIGLAALHALAALKHALIDRDGTLRRMVRPR
jgi:cytochrome b561